MGIHEFSSGTPKNSPSFDASFRKVEESGLDIDDSDSSLEDDLDFDFDFIALEDYNECVSNNDPLTFADHAELCKKKGWNEQQFVEEEQQGNIFRMGRKKKASEGGRTEVYIDPKIKEAVDRFGFSVKRENRVEVYRPGEFRSYSFTPEQMRKIHEISRNAFEQLEKSRKELEEKLESENNIRERRVAWIKAKSLVKQDQFPNIPELQAESQHRTRFTYQLEQRALEEKKNAEKKLKRQEMEYAQRMERYRQKDEHKEEIKADNKKFDEKNAVKNPSGNKISLMKSTLRKHL